MKKLLLVPALFLAIGSSQAAEDQKANYEAMRQNVGIGLGTLIWSNVGTGLGWQVLAATTNPTCGTQTFAVTTGTSEAKKWDKIVDVPAVRDYVRDNMDVLARDMAAGRGESLETLAELAGIPEADRPAFYANARASFAQIYSSPNVTSDEIVVNLSKLSA